MPRTQLTSVTSRSDAGPRPAAEAASGSPDVPDGGPRFVVRVGLPYTAAMIGANTLGAVVTLGYAATVIPPDIGGDDGSRLRLNVVAFLVYLVASLFIGILVSLWRFRPTLAWLLADRLPTEPERRDTLRQPLRQTVVHATLWWVAVVLFLALNAGYSWALARDAALAALLGGLFTCATGYLLAERLLRPVTVKALASGQPEPAAAPGVVTRVVWAWAVGAGVPILGAGLAVVLRGAADDLAKSTPTLVLLGIGLLASFASMLLLARSISAATGPVRTAIRAVTAGDTNVTVPVSDAGEIGQLQHAVNEMTHGLHERERLRDMFGRQVGPDVAEQALARGVELGGESRDVALLFVDLDGSTAFASEHRPEDVVELLNTFFRVVVDVIDEHGGLVNKFFGDGALCVFGLPLEDSDAATAALTAGRVLRDRIADLDDEQINAGIGISAGTVVAGNVGAESRFEYTVIGDPVNEASRLTDLAKTSGCRVLATDVVVGRADRQEAARWQLEDSVVLPGRTRSTRLATTG